MPRIKKLKLTHFRGATTPVEILFKADKPLLIIYGENGSGKSTLIDAIDLVCNRSLGSVRLKSSTTNHHIPALGKKLTDVSVELSTQNQTWTGKLTNAGVSISGEGSTPKVSVLRRSQMLRLVEAPPAKCYDELKRFIDVGDIEKCEATLRNACNAAKKRLDTAIEVLTSSTETLEKLWREEGAPGASAIEWATEKAKADVTELERKKALFSEVAEALKIVRLRRGEYANAVETLEEANRALHDIEEERRTAELVVASGSLSLVTLLKEAQTYLENSEERGLCPVCEQSADTTSLQARMAERLTEMESLQALGGRLNGAKIVQSQAEGRANNARTQWIVGSRELVRALLKSGLKAVEKLGLNSERYVTFVSSERSDDEALAVSESLYLEVATWEEALETRRDRLQADLNQRNLIRIQFEMAERERGKALQYILVNDHLNKMHERIHQARIEFTDRVLQVVSGECNRLYEKLHPSEKVGSLALSMKEGVKGSVETKSAFADRAEVPPQAYYSEAHLDTLGFCLFMAIARHTCGAEGILVLDDVFTSVDADHATRIL